MSFAAKPFNTSTRQRLIRQLIEELLVDARSRLHRWRALTNQPAQIDTGYVAQHLVSVATGLPGGGFRGKGDDLTDGSEIKSANYLDALDSRGASSPRWNLSVTQVDDVEKYFDVPHLYFVSVDLPPRQAQILASFEKRSIENLLAAAQVPNSGLRQLPRSFDRMHDFFSNTAAERLTKVFPHLSAVNRIEKIQREAEAYFHATSELRLQITNACRIRIWQVDPRMHISFRDRYQNWIDRKARPKFERPSTQGKRQDANFQLFPPRNGSLDLFARHGSTRSGELPPIHIRLEGTSAAKRILGIERSETGEYAFSSG